MATQEPSLYDNRARMTEQEGAGEDQIEQGVVRRDATGRANHALEARGGTRIVPRQEGGTGDDPGRQDGDHMRGQGAA